MLTTLRRVSYEEKTEPLLAKPSGLKTWIAQITELLSRGVGSLRPRIPDSQATPTRSAGENFNSQVARGPPSNLRNLK